MDLIDVTNVAWALEAGSIDIREQIFEIDANEIYALFLETESQTLIAVVGKKCLECFNYKTSEHLGTHWFKTWEFAINNRAKLKKDIIYLLQNNATMQEMLERNEC